MSRDDVVRARQCLDELYFAIPDEARPTMSRQYIQVNLVLTALDSLFAARVDDLPAQGGEA